MDAIRTAGFERDTGRAVDSLERHLIQYCAPTLASLKTGSLFTLDYLHASELHTMLRIWNMRLNPKGVHLRALRCRGCRALVYVYRPDRLAGDLSGPEAAALLRRFGYTATDVEHALDTLGRRLGGQVDFPHEIGLFLGYPLCDVVGFIENGGKCEKCTGCWKVYGDEHAAQRQFCRFNKCRDVYTRLWSRGRSVTQLTV